MNREQLIFYLLANSDKPLSSSDIGKFIDKSIRTVKYDMEKVAILTSENGGILNSKRGTGYWIDVIDKEKFSEALYQIGIRGAYFKNHTREINPDYFRIMQFLIIQPDYFKIEDISEKFYISRTVVHEIIGLFRELLKNVNLRLESKPNFGLRIIGDEFSIRLAMIMLFQFHFHKIEFTSTIEEFYVYFEKNQKEITDVRNIFLNIIRKRRFSVTDSLTQALSRYLILQKNRTNAGLKVIFDESTLITIKEFRSAFQISIEIYKQLSDYYNQTFCYNEISAFALLLVVSHDNPRDIEIKTEYPPLAEYINQVVYNYIDILLSNKEFNSLNKKSLYSELLPMLIPSIIQHFFNFNFIGLFTPKYIYPGKLELHARHMTNLFNQIMYNKFHAIIPENVNRKILNDFSILLKKMNNQKETLPINILISSNYGIRSAENIGRLLYKFINPKILGNVQFIELYEGRIFSENEFDLFVLEDIDMAYYDYSWPVILFNSGDYENDFNKLINKIHSLSQSTNDSYKN